MTNKLISLVIITFILSTGRSYSDERFLFPKEKPSIFKKINKDFYSILSSISGQVLHAQTLEFSHPTKKKWILFFF